MWLSLFKGFIIGLLTGMPLGPIGALCLRTTLTKGRLYGLVSGLGASVADSIYGFIAAFSFAIISTILTKHQNNLRFFGGIIIVIFGIRIFYSKEQKKTEIVNGLSLLKSFIATFLLSITNPATVFSFLIIFSAYGTTHLGSNTLSKFILVLGVFCGSILWWLILIAVASVFSHKLTSRNLKVVNKTLGVFITCFGIVILLSLGAYKSLGRPALFQMKIFDVFSRINHIGRYKSN